MGKIADSLDVTVLLESIGKEKKWTSLEIENDLSIIKKHRLITVNDLRSLSPESWAQIELLPLVKDLLRSAIKFDNQDKPKKTEKKEKKKEKKEKKKEKKEKKKEFELGEPVVPIVFSEEPQPITSDLLCEDSLTIENTIKNGTAPELFTLDDTSTTDEDEPTSPSDVPTRRKSVTFSNDEPLVGTAASEGKKKKKKEKKKKSNTMASTHNDDSNLPYTQPTLVKDSKKLPLAPANDTFLQTLRDKLTANYIDTQ